MNKATSWPKRLRRYIYLAFRCLFETSTTSQGQISTEENFHSYRSREKGSSVASFRVVTGHDYQLVHLFKIGLANSPLCTICKSLPMTGEHLSDCLALLHVLSQDNFGVLLAARVTSAFIGLQDALCTRGRWRA
ncbi:hypothetical protein TNCV_4747281 [Trichonephila clavipes]|nr:hypothetical protein TNCV_4747281 [Trichonephila clavipes]